MTRFLRKAGLLAVMGVLVTGLMTPASADESAVKCVATEAGEGADGRPTAASASCTALGREMTQACPGSPCTEVVKAGTALGAMAAAVLVENGLCTETPGAVGECTAVDTGGATSAGRLTIKISYSCCPREINIEIIINL